MSVIDIQECNSIKAYHAIHLSSHIRRELLTADISNGNRRQRAGSRGKV